MSKHKILSQIQLKTNGILPINIHKSVLPFDIFCAETNFVSTENSKLFALSLLKYGRSIADKIRLVFFINNASPGYSKIHFNLIYEIKRILNGFNVTFVNVNPELMQKYHGWGKTNDASYQSLAHGLLIMEYLRNHSSSSLYTLLCHSDTEFAYDLSDIILDWQQRLQDNNKVGICYQKIQDNGIMFMNSWFSLWKTPILYEYAVIRDIPFYGIDQRRIGNRFYDTGAYIQSYIENDFTIDFVDTPIVANHWGGMSSEKLFSDKLSNKYFEKQRLVSNKIMELEQELITMGVLS